MQVYIKFRVFDIFFQNKFSLNVGNRYPKWYICSVVMLNSNEFSECSDMKEMKEQIFQDFKKGKIDRFYTVYYPQLMLYAIRHLGENHSFLAEDCVQDAIYKTYLRRHSFDSLTPFMTYLYASVYHSCISIQRHEAAKDNYLAARSMMEEPDFLHSMIEQETLDLLYGAIRELPEKYRNVFELSFEQGLKNAEIARILNMTESGVKRRKAQFLEMMRQKLKDKGKEDCMSVMLLLSIGMDIPV